MSRDVTLPSGAVLTVSPAPFPDARKLHQAVLKEFRGVNMKEEDMETVSLYKDFYCSAFASKEVDEALWRCMNRCLYNGLKVVEFTFEPESARGDYTLVAMEVAKENLLPFVKDLYAELRQLLKMGTKSPT